MLGLTKASSLTGEVRARTEKRSVGLILSTAGDCVFLRRVILQSRSDGESQLIQSKALELEQLLQTMPIAGELPIEEECPACKSKIPFRDIRTAACDNGHPWSECLRANLRNHLFTGSETIQFDAQSPRSHLGLLRCERASGVHERRSLLSSRVQVVTHPRSRRAS